MSSLVLDASAAVELVTRSPIGDRLIELIAATDVLWVPDGLFDVETNGTVRRLELHGPLNTAQAATARLRLSHLRLRRRRVAYVADRAWQLRHSVSLTDACYVALAEFLGCPLLTTDMKLVNAPNLPVETVHP